MTFIPTAPLRNGQQAWRPSHSAAQGCWVEPSPFSSAQSRRAWRLDAADRGASGPVA
ncbi:MAG: hypothetical protein VKM92_05840 [Cyanobacteriota bacterium]|nr:hypothetical protein [Cyanobacteriota bacterium]